MALTKQEKIKQYEQAWELLDFAQAALFPIQQEEDISDLMGRIEASKSMVQDKIAPLHEFDPN